MINIDTIETAIVSNNSDVGKKLLLADGIIETFMPVFSEEIETKRRRLENDWQDVEKLKKQLSASKKQLKFLTTQLKREKTISAIITEIQRMIDRDVLYGNKKHAALETLQQLDDLDNATLVKRLASIRSVAAKHIKKIVKT